MTDFILSLDQGTTSTRAMVFDRSGSPIAQSRLEHRQIFPQPGWVEHDPIEIWNNTQAVMRAGITSAGLTRHDIAAIGITNQRETTVVWNSLTGEPVYNAIVWQDTRTQHIVERLAVGGGVDRFRELTGLPLATYFSASKLAWILDSVEDARAAAGRGDLLFGTIDTWLLWNLTGGPDGGVHVTDVTNASRTMLMDLRTLDWDDELLAAFEVPRSMLPQIRSSSEVYGIAGPRSVLSGVRIAGMLGDQQTAMFGHAAFDAGSSKCTYGTGNFVVMNTGERLVRSDHGLLTTVAYRLGDQPARYALEGSIAVTGSLVQWLRDNLELVRDAADIEDLARTVDNNGGVYIVPAFSGLFAPHWRPDARGVIVGLTGFARRGHIARASLEATAFQTVDVIDAVTADIGIPPAELRVDGGMVGNSTLMQFQADVLGVDVVRPVVAETTALGAAYAAGLAVGVWSGTDELAANWREGHRWTPRIASDERARLMHQWAKAVQRSLDWVD